MYKTCRYCGQWFSLHYEMNNLYCRECIENYYYDLNYLIVYNYLKPQQRECK